MSKVPDTKTGKSDTKTTGKDDSDKSGPAPTKTGSTASDKSTEPSDAKASAKAPEKPAATKAGGPTTTAKEQDTDGARPKKASGSGFLRGFSIAAALVLAVAIGSVLTVKDWYPAVEPYVGDWVSSLMPSSAKEENAARLSAIEQRIDAMETAANEAASADALADLEAARSELSRQIDDIMNRLDVAERALASLRSTAQAMTSGGGSAAVDAFSGRLDEIDALSQDLAASRAESRAALDELAREVEALAASRAGASAASVQAQTVVLTTAQIRRAVVAGNPFEEPLDGLAASTADDAEIGSIIATFRPHAANGVATVETLRRDFGKIAGTIVQAGQALDESDWMSSAINKVSSLVSVRRTDGEGDPQSADAIVALAEKRLAAGDLAGAVGALDGLPDSGRDAAATWLAAANARLAVDDALDDLHALALRRLQSSASAASAAGEG